MGEAGREPTLCWEIQTMGWEEAESGEQGRRQEGREGRRRRGKGGGDS